MENKILKLLLSLVLIVSAAAGIYFTLTTPVPVLSGTVAEGAVIKPADIVETRIFKNQLVDTTILHGTELVGKVAKFELPENTPITTGAVEERVGNEIDSETPDADTVVVPVKVDPNNVPADLKTGDIVNVIAYFPTGSLEDVNSFTVGFNEMGTVSKVSSDETGIFKVDILMKKAVSTKVMTAVSEGDVYVIRDLQSNDVQLDSVTTKDIYLESFSEQPVETPEVIEPTVEEE